MARNMSENNYVVKSPKLTITPSDESRPWDTDWIITLTKEEDKQIGTLSLAGEKVLGTIPLQVNLVEEYRNKGYGTEVITMMVNWLFRIKSIYEVSAETDKENDKAVKALQKSGFVYRSIDGRTEHYSITKPKTAWTGLYLFIGVFLGLIFGIVFSHILISMAAGIIISTSIGLSLDMAANKEREKITGGKR